MSILVFGLAMAFSQVILKLHIKSNGIMIKEKHPASEADLIISPPIKEPVPVAANQLLSKFLTYIALLVESGIYRMMKC